MLLLKPKKRPEKDVGSQFYVFDTETKGLCATPEAFLFGVIYGFDGYTIIKSVKAFKEEFKKPKYNKKYIFCHNAEYDYNVIYGNIIKHMDNAAVYNGKFIMAKKHDVTFCDSLNIYPMSLAKIGESLGYSKGKISDDLKDGTGNYTDEDITYCIRDCEIIYEALLKFYKTIGEVRVTLGSSALTLFRNTFLKKPIFFKDNVNEFFKSYYGGRCEAFKIGTTEAKKYDINSMYPYIMASYNFPNPANLRITYPAKGKFRWLLKNKEGQATLTVKHSYHKIPTLPVKRESDGKLLFPTGEFKGTWAFPELRYALKSGLVTILKIHEVVSANAQCTPFKGYVNKLYNQRLKAKGIDKLILKLLLNNLYGKLAQRDKLNSTYYETTPSNLIYDYLTSGKYFEIKPFSTERSDMYIETPNDKPTNKYHTIPSYASYITSIGRVMLLEAMHANMKAKPVYCDTDCIAFEKKPNLKMHQKKLGSFKIEDEIITEIRGLKNYSVKVRESVIDKIKGIPKSAIKDKKVAYKFNFKRQIKTKEGLRRNQEVGIFYNSNKIILNSYNKRLILKTGNTKPLKI